MVDNASIPRKEMQRLLRALQACEERFNSIIPRSADGVLIVDDDGFVRFANPAAMMLFRLEGEELVGQPFGHPVVAGETTEIDFIPRGGDPGIAEMRIVRTEWQGEPAFLATLRDISDRKQMEQALQSALAESEAARDRIDGIIRSIAEGLLLTDASGRLILINQAAEEMLGVCGPEVIGLPVAEVFSGEGPRKKVLDHLEDGEKFDLPLPGGEGGQPHILQVEHSTIRDRQGRRSGLVSVLQDVTREREIERMKSEFVSIAAHELRSPLTSIVGFTELLLTTSDLTPEGRKELLETIKRQALALAEIVTTLLDISLIESGRGIPLERENTMVEEIVRQADPFMRMNSNAFRFEVSLTESATVLSVDTKKISQVLENLLSNAVKYTPGGGLIRICGKRVGGDYLLAVKDQGIGMSAEQVERVFDKFYRVDHSNTAAGGIGLGMNIVRSIVDIHGGNIWVESGLGMGTTVRFTLPVLWEEKSPT